MPCILFWQFNHFIVLESIQDKSFYVNDPAFGRRKIEFQEFSKGFTGVALSLYPTSSFQPKGSPFSLFKALKQQISSSKKGFWYITIASLLVSIPGILIPGFSMIFIDHILIQHNQHWLPSLLSTIMLTAILYSGLTWLKEKQLLKLQLKLKLVSISNFFWHVLRLPLEFFTQRYAGDINERIMANVRINQMISQDLSSAIIDLLSLFLYLVMMFFLSWKLTVVSLFFCICSILYFLYRYPQLLELGIRLSQEQGKLMGLEMNLLDSIESLKGMSLEISAFQKWRRFYTRRLNCQTNLNRLSQKIELLQQFLIGLSTVFILMLGCFQIMQGYMTIGSLVAFQALFLSFYHPIVKLFNFSSQIQQIRGDFLRLQDVMKHRLDNRLMIENQSVIFTPSEPVSGIDIKNLTYGFSPLVHPLLKLFLIILNQGVKPQ